MNRLRPPFWEVFRALVDFVLRPEYRDELERASQEYFGTSRPHDTSFALATSDGAWVEGAEYLAFLEWTIFDRACVRHRNPLIEAFLNSSADLGGDPREDVSAWATAALSFFEVADVVANGIFVRDLMRTGGELEHFVAEPPSSLNLRGRELILVRLLPWDGDLRLAGAVNVFPDSARTSLLEYLNELRAQFAPDMWAEVLRDVLPALSRFQTASAIEETPLFPGGYPDHLSSATVETLVEHGRSCMERGEWTEALLCFQRALYADPMHIGARNGVGLVHLNRGDVDQARRAFSSLLEVHPNDSVALLNMGNVAIMSGHLDEARHLLERAREEALDDTVRAHALFNIGLASLVLNDHARAVRSFRDASRMADQLESPSDAASLHFRIGSNLAASERYGAALTYFRKSVRCVPEFAEGHLQMAESYQRLGRWRDAAREYRHAVRLGRGGGRAWLEIGKCMLEIGQWPRAEEALWRAVELLPGLVEAHVHLAQAMLAQNRLEEARSRCEVALYHAPRAVEVLVMVGDVARRLGDYKASTRYLRRALRLQPKHESARGLLAQVRKEERTFCT